MEIIKLITNTERNFRSLHPVYPDATGNLYPDILQVPSKNAPISSFDEAKKRSDERGKRRRKKLKGRKVISLNEDKTLI